MHHTFLTHFYQFINKIEESMAPQQAKIQLKRKKSSPIISLLTQKNEVNNTKWKKG